MELDLEEINLGVSTDTPENEKVTVEEKGDVEEKLKGSFSFFSN